MRTSFLMGGEKLFSLPHWYKYTVSPLHKNLLSFKLSKMWTCPGKRPRKKKGKRSNWRTTEIHNAWNGKGIFFIWEGTVHFWGTRPIAQNGTRRLQQPFQVQSSATMSSMMSKREPLPRHHWIVLSRGNIELNPARKRTCAINVRCEWNCTCLPSIANDPSALPSPISSPYSSQKLFFPLNASCNTIRLNMLSLFFCFYILLNVKNILDLLQ